jgi:hypothetical protein
MKDPWDFKPCSVAKTKAGESKCDQSVLIVGMHQGIVMCLDQIKVVLGKECRKVEGRVVSGKQLLKATRSERLRA